jgi:RHS repeat-associated protein
MGWNQIYYYPSLRLADVNGDGKPDLCGRGLAGVYCALNNGNGTFAPEQLWETFFTDANGYNQAPYGNTMMLADINGDGKADLCFRQVSGIVCELSTGSGFGSPFWATSDFSDAMGWNQIYYYPSLRLADVNGDGKPDLCGRGLAGVYCALNQGNGTFGPARSWETFFTDANGYNQAPYGNTMMLTDINGDGKADLCFRQVSGIVCELSAGNAAWQNQDLSALTGNILAASGTAISLDPGAPAGSFGAPAGGMHAYYLGANQHIYFLTWNASTSSWQNTDLTANTTNGNTTNHQPAAGTPLTGLVSNDGYVRLYFLDASQHIHETFCCNTSSWVDNDMMTTLGIAAAGTGTAMTSTGTSAGNKVHVYYQNGTQHIEHMYLSNTGWFNQDLTTTAATDVLDSGFVSLDVGGFTVTACFGPSASPGCSGQQQNVASPNVATSLAQALNATNSPVTATASGSTINVTWKVAGPTNALVYPLTTNHDNPGLFSNASFSSTGLNFSGGASSWFNSPFVTTYAYNAIGQLTSASKGNQTSTYVYDALGRRTSASTPEMAGGSATMQYNDLGLLTQSTDPRGVIGTYGYDTLNRITSVSYNVGTTGAPATPSLGYTYGNSATSFNNGRLLTMTDGLGSETYTYDNMGRRVRCDKVINGVTYTTLYQYNLSGEMTQIQYPSGRQVKPAYDSIGRPIGVSDTMNSINTTYASGINYNVAQQITQFTYGNGVVANMGYSSDGRQQLTSLQYTKGAQTLFGLNYTYLQNGGNNGQITGIVDLVDNGRSATYRYDPLARLNQAFTAGSTAFPNWDLAFSYDQYGNRTDETPQSDTSPSATVPSNHLLFTSNPQTNRTTSGGYAYDGNGNMTNDGVNSLVYNGANEIISSNLGAANYQYDGYGLRARKCGATCTASSTVYLYMGGNVIAEYDNGAAPTTPSREYIYLGNRLAKIEGGAAQYYHVDHLSVRALSDAGGTKIADRGHFPFGEQWYASGTATKFQFTNYERDLSDTGNDYASARYYINRQGRFSSPDPLNSSPNGYAYVMNDPINHTDSTGMVCDDDCQFNRFAAMFGGGDQCTVNGINAPCGLAKNLVDSDNAAICPNNNCGFQWDPTKGFQPTVKTGDDGQLWLWHPGTGFLVVSLLVTGDDGNYHYVEGYEGTGFWYPESAVHWGFGHIFDYTGTPMINGTRTPEEQKQYLNSFLPICDQIYNQYVDAGKEQAWKNVAINAGWAGAACTALKKNCLPAAAGAAYASDLNMALTGWNMSDIHRSYASQLAAAGCYTWNGKGWNVNF